MTYLQNVDLLKAEFDYRTEQLRGVGRRRGRRAAGRNAAKRALRRR